MTPIIMNCKKKEKIKLYFKNVFQSYKKHVLIISQFCKKHALIIRLVILSITLIVLLFLGLKLFTLLIPLPHEQEEETRKKNADECIKLFFNKGEYPEMITEDQNRRYLYEEIMSFSKYVNIIKEEDGTKQSAYFYREDPQDKKEILLNNVLKWSLMNLPKISSLDFFLKLKGKGKNISKYESEKKIISLIRLEDLDQIEGTLKEKKEIFKENALQNTGEIKKDIQDMSFLSSDKNEDDRKKALKELEMKRDLCEVKSRFQYYLFFLFLPLMTETKFYTDSEIAKKISSDLPEVKSDQFNSKSVILQKNDYINKILTHAKRAENGKYKGAVKFIEDLINS